MCIGKFESSGTKIMMRRSIICQFSGGSREEGGKGIEGIANPTGKI